jgi:hypothetical protein
MQQPEDTEAVEAVDAQLRDKVWTFAQRGVIALVVFLAGVLLGYRLWGQATQLQEQVEDLTERNQALVKERDTERSKAALIERDKNELEKQLQETKARAAAAEAKAEAAAGDTEGSGDAAPAPATGAPPPP